MNRIIRFEHNEPITLALVSKMSLPVKGAYGWQQLYVCVDGSRFYASEALHQKIESLNPKTDEPFTICKRKQGRNVIWDVWLSPGAEKQRAVEEMPQIDAQLRDVPKIAPQLATASEVRAALAPTGTEGPAPLPKLVPMRPRPNTIPFNVAFREVTAFVKTELGATGEGWNDEARQGAVSTILIAAAQHGWIGPWERGE